MSEFVTPNQVKEVAGTLRGLVARLVPDDVTVREAPEMWTALEDIRRLAAGAQTLLARRIDASSAPKDAGLRSGAEWIARMSGGSQRSASDQVQASKRVTRLPLVEAALRRGDISVSQAEEIAAAGVVDPESESRLLELAAVASLGELRDECARSRAAADPDPDATHRRLCQQRRLRLFRNTEGAWCLSGRGTIDAGAEFETVLRVITDEIFGEARGTGVREPVEAYRFDAVVEMARRAWAHMNSTTNAVLDLTPDHRDGEPTDDNPEPDQPDSPSRPPTVGAPRERGRGPGVNPWCRAVLRIDYEALIRGWVEGEEVCEITDVGAVPVRVARMLLGQAIVDLVITKGTGVANRTYLGRGPDVAQRIALLWDQPECSRRGCNQPAVEIDHRDPFADTHHTRLDELDRYCRREHDLKTYEGWALVPGIGKRDMVPPDDPRHPGNPTFHRRRKRSWPPDTQRRTSPPCRPRRPRSLTTTSQVHRPATNAP